MQIRITIVDDILQLDPFKVPTRRCFVDLIVSLDAFLSHDHLVPAFVKFTVFLNVRTCSHFSFLFLTAGHGLVHNRHGFAVVKSEMTRNGHGSGQADFKIAVTANNRDRQGGMREGVVRNQARPSLLHEVSRPKDSKRC